eukprot:TRINITY_DN19338_c0_g1_i1.p1 TRINITY_DN19338_c0_g1~~TRINITY_DN19338_c0_g1_i1.p1  ORF type:complete len:509 (-),score=133.99 TRINITY_DN19338_c0_g1_i1:277-1803(-)
MASAVTLNSAQISNLQKFLKSVPSLKNADFAAKVEFKIDSTDPSKFDLTFVVKKVVPKAKPELKPSSASAPAGTLRTSSSRPGGLRPSTSSVRSTAGVAPATRPGAPRGAPAAAPVPAPTPAPTAQEEPAAAVPAGVAVPAETNAADAGSDAQPPAAEVSAEPAGTPAAPPPEPADAPTPDSAAPAAPEAAAAAVEPPSPAPVADDSTPTQPSTPERPAPEAVAASDIGSFRAVRRIGHTPSTEPGEFNGPIGVAAFPEGFAVCDQYNYRVQLFTPEGKLLRSFGHFGTSVGQFRSPAGACVDFDSNFYVTDTRAHAVLVFSRDGTFIRGFGQRGIEPSRFNNPRGIAYAPAPQNFLLIADRDNHRIQQVDVFGLPVRQFGSYGSTDGEFYYPEAVALDRSTGNVYVADSGNGRIQVFSADGKFLFKFNDHLLEPRGLAISSNGRVFVADYRQNKILEFALDGSWVQSFGGPGDALDNFDGAYGVCVDSAGRLAVADRERHSLVIFEP